MNIGLLCQLCLGAAFYLERRVGQIRLGNDVVTVENASVLLVAPALGFTIKVAILGAVKLFKTRP